MIFKCKNCGGNVGRRDQRSLVVRLRQHDRPLIRSGFFFDGINVRHCPVLSFPVARLPLPFCAGLSLP